MIGYPGRVRVLRTCPCSHNMFVYAEHLRVLGTRSCNRNILAWPEHCRTPNDLVYPKRCVLRMCSRIRKTVPLSFLSVRAEIVRALRLRSCSQSIRAPRKWSRTRKKFVYLELWPYLQNMFVHTERDRVPKTCVCTSQCIIASFNSLIYNI